MNNLIFVLAALILALAPLRVAAQSVPALVNYQGRLSNPDGSPLSTADYQLTFNIYDSATNGTLIWGPQIFDGATGAGHGVLIPVVQGYFNVMLGPVDTNGSSLANAFNGTTRYVEITVTNHAPITPRQQILTAPFAFQAANAAKLAGYDWSALLNTNDPVNGKLSGSKLAQGTVTAQQLAPGLPTNQLWFLGTPSSSIYYSGGNVGIGTNAPTRRLHVKGDTLTPLILERNQVSSQSGLILYQPETTDWNSLDISYRADTTGPGGTNEVDLVDIRTFANVHNNATRAGQLAFLTANGGAPQERMRLTETGNLGIGKTNPATALDVNGTVTAATFNGSGVGLTDLGPGVVTLTNLAARTTGNNVGIGGIALSANSGNLVVPTGNTNYMLTNLTVTIQTTGRPVLVQLVPTIAGEGNSYIFPSGSIIYVTLTRTTGGGTVQVGTVGFGGNAPTFPPSAVLFLDQAPAGQSSYQLYASTGTSSAVYFVNCKLAAFEF